MKKLISILLAIVMVLSLAVTAFAAGAGSITVNSVSPGTTYTIYRMMDLESYNATMAGIYTTCVNTSTLDESPMAYKNMDEIVANIQPTAEIVAHIKPIYNFKAAE